MLRGRLKKILSVFLALVLVISLPCYADNVFVAGAPTSTTGTLNASSNINVTAGNVGSGDRLYPGSLAKASDAPTSANSITPATNKSSTISSSDKKSSNIISNGYTWESSNTENQAPVTEESVSPGGGKSSKTSGKSNDGVSHVGPGASTTEAEADSVFYASSNPQANVSSTIFKPSPYAVNGYNLLNAGLPDPIISSDGALLANVTTGEIYYAKNLTKAYAPAGLTALLTGYLLLKSKQLNDVLTVTQTAISNIESGATTVGLKAGDTITVQDALYALYIRSACDVANVIAENVSGSQQAFVNLMNQTAASFGATSTVFANPTGLNNDSQVSTIYDMAVIMSNIVQEPMLNLAMQTPTYTLPATAHRGAIKITVKNEFINPAKKKNYYPGVTSSRMGYTSKAKYTMASLVVHNDQFLVAIVMYSNNTQYVDSKRLLNFGKTAVDKLMGSNITNVTEQSTDSSDVNNTSASAINESLLSKNQPTTDSTSSNQSTAKKTTSNIISNGYTWTSSNTENQAPVAQTLSSPGGNGSGGKGVTVKTNNNAKTPVAETSNSLENNTFYSSEYASNAAQASSGTGATSTANATSQSGSNIISNGYTWTSNNTENQAPVTQTINNPSGANANNVTASAGQTSTTQSATINSAQPSPSTDANMATLGSVINNLAAAAQSAAMTDTSGAWVQDGIGWTFIKADGQKAKNEWVITGGKRYCMDANGYMITGWREFSNGAIYYFNPANGEMRYNTWVNTTTGAYYLQTDGTLARADSGQTKTISTQVGNYIIDENGKAIQKVQ